MTPLPRTRLGLPGDLYARPLRDALLGRGFIAVDEDAPARLAHRLRDRTLDAALLSPIEYAREGSVYGLVGRNSISSSSASDTITLHFREGLHGITTFAADPAYPSEIVLATIILAEEFDVEPSIIPATPPLDAMLQRADAALLVGDASLRASSSHGNHIDLVECWNDLTDLPYVHGVWCAREGTLAPQILEAIRSAETGNPGGPDTDYLGSFSHAFGSRVKESLRELFHYAYYRGIIPDVPDLTFLEETDEQELPPDISPN